MNSYPAATFGCDSDAGLSGDRIESFLGTVAATINLEDLDLDLDETLAGLLTSLPHSELRTTLFRAYVGYAFYDVLTLPMSASADLLEMDEIRVARISPMDCSSMHADPGDNVLMGTQLYNFGAFFSRAARENDYIWGRLHAAKRMTDFVLDAAGPDALPEGFDLEDFQRRLYLAVLETEGEHVEQQGDMVARLKKRFGGTV